VLSRSASLLLPPPTAWWPPVSSHHGYRRARFPVPKPWGHRGSLQFPRHPSVRSTLPTPEDSWAPAPGPRCRPWPSPRIYRLGFLLASLREGSIDDAASFASCCGPASCPSPLRNGLPALQRPDFARRRQCCYWGPWRLPRPDFHRLAVVSLLLGYVNVPPFNERGARAAGRTDTPKNRFYLPSWQELRSRCGKQPELVAEIV
jgi:hypothetical protein